jgi:signal transduction histidine kinase
MAASAGALGDEPGSYLWWTQQRSGAAYLDEVSRGRAFVASHGLDLLIVVAAVEAGVATALRDDLVHPTGPRSWIGVAGVTGAVLALLWRRRFPFGAPAATWLTCAALSFLDGRLIVNQAAVFVVGMGASVLMGNQRSARRAYVGLAVTATSALLVVYNDPGRPGDEIVSIPVLFSIGWLVGYALRERTQQTEAAEERARIAELEREAAARVAVAEERGRIARELHDVVAHAVSVIVLQVGAVRHRMPEEAAAEREALRNVEEAGRTALAEMRRLLAAMREDDAPPELAPHPGLDDLDRLVRDVRAAGLDVRLEVRGDPVPLPRGLDLSAYRILQEALTNSLKHSGADHAEVTVEYAPDQLCLQVRDHGRSVERVQVPAGGGGHGLVGIRERVKLFGGDLTTGPVPGGGFLLRARLPLGGGGS